MRTINGIGTCLLGRREPATDGSYLATKWVVVFFLPMLPLASYRVLPGPASAGLLSYETNYYLQPQPLCWPQVLNWYLATLLLGPLLAGGVVLALLKVFVGF